MTSEQVLTVSSVSHGFVDQEGQHLRILRDVSLQINRGDSVAIVGPSGAGKSTLLALLAGLDVPNQGEITLLGQPFSTLSEDSRAKARQGAVGFVFQSFQLLPGLTALENVMLPLELAGVSVRDAKAKAAEWLSRVGLAERLNHRPRMLSGGEQQRTAVARAFVTDPALLFADEPTGNLDRRTGESISDLLFQLNADTGATLILVTHDERLASRCERIFTLDEGRLQETATCSA
ncbi:MAG: ABC transporter ATP-binding protein [Gammaproteobacteria bacterium]|nr:ABC transporter ATP-binding protein [Gammaproteobacteria bacterium]